MAVILVDGQEVQIGDDERLNCIQAADRGGVQIPFYCWHPGLSVVASCRMCLVEVGQKNKETGKIDMQPKLVPGCQTPVKDGTVILTDSPKVKANQQYVQEALLIDHPVDCPICDQAGECWLQDYYFNYGHKERRADVQPFHSDRRDLGEHVTLFVDRCVMCTRCVRFTREVSGEAELQVINRGSHAEIDVFPGFPIDNELSGNVNDLCPVGALCSTDFLYQQRVWFMSAHDSVCTGCSSNCAIQVHENNDKVYRIQPRYNPNVNDWWMCDRGRYENDYLHAPERLDAVKKRGLERFEDVEWTTALTDINKAVRDSAQHHGGQSVVGIISPFLTNEDAFLFAKYLTQVSPQTVLAMGPIRSEGEDRTYPKGFTVHAEKCPNRQGIEAILKHFRGQVITWEQFVSRAEAGEFRIAYFTGNDRAPWLDSATAERLDKIPFKIVQDILPNDLARRAGYVLPGATFAEKGGSYVNFAGVIQMSEWAVRPPGAAHVDGQIFFDLLERPGLYQATDVLQELAAEVPFFARAAEGIPEAGLNLITGTEIRPLTTQLGTVTHPTPTFRSAQSRMIEVER